MKKEEFYQEVKDSSICPENFEKIYKKFQYYQGLALDTLSEFHKICEQNNISYQLAYGSLLGAIRDNGQIPWDYDIDVFVPYEEKDKLIKTLKEKLDKKYYFYCPEVDNKCRHVFIRMAPISYRTEVLHVDVFFIAGSPKETVLRDNYSNTIKDISQKRYDKLVKIFDETFSLKQSIKKIVAKMKVLRYNAKVEYSKLDDMCKKYPIKDSEICLTVDPFANMYRFKSEELKETVLINTDLGVFRIPKNYESILKQIYGDYREIMPLENRLNEMMNSFRRLEKYSKK